MEQYEKVCHPKRLPSKIPYIAPYWHLAFENVLRYQKERGLQEIHKITDKSRIEKGLSLYTSNSIKEITVTTEFGGDVHAIVQSDDRKKEYHVIMKNFLPDTLPQYNHERERYISDLLVTCQCTDHILNRYASNVSTLCKHTIAVIYFLQDTYNAPKVFLKPEEIYFGYKKSEVDEIVTNIEALPLVKFTQRLNILLLKNFRGMEPACGISLHRISNETQMEIGKPQWMTFTNPDDVMSILGGLLIVYNQMNPEYAKRLQNIQEQPEEIPRLGVGEWLRKLRRRKKP